ncbi:Semaphorin-6D [Anas platyrhynchos]|uniref:Semaphorin-6D n=1 Tax=Anas platyrhynchos TaxID=8839 RepID=R0L475_ANAPL|nr:Semaphorin-6D [Anas platyrhynchos]
MLRLNSTLFVAARDHIYAFDLGQDKRVLYPERALRVCAEHRPRSRSCLAARDPYCVWLPPGGCVPFSEDLPAGFEQDIEGSTGLTGTCHGFATPCFRFWPAVKCLDSDGVGDKSPDTAKSSPGFSGRVQEERLFTRSEAAT